MYVNIHMYIYIYIHKIYIYIYTYTYIYIHNIIHSFFLGKERSPCCVSPAASAMTCAWRSWPGACGASPRISRCVRRRRSCTAVARPRGTRGRSCSRQGHHGKNMKKYGKVYVCKYIYIYLKLRIY